MQVAESGISEMDGLSVFRHIIRSDGIPGIFRGFVASAIGSLPGRVLALISLEVSKDMTQKYTKGLNMPEASRIGIANGVAGMVSNLVSCVYFVSLYVVCQRLMVEGLPWTTTCNSYDVDCMPPPCMGSPSMPRYMFREYKELCERVMDATNFAIGKISAETGKTYELVDVENVVGTRTFMLLLTFTAKKVVVEADANAETAVKTFQAMVYQPLFKDLQLEEWKIKQDPVATVG